MSNSSYRYGLFDFSDYIADRVADFTGRTWVFRAIDEWLAKEKPSRYFLLTGEPGSGKSAVAARLAQFSAGQVVQPPECQVLAPGFLRAAHFCRATDSYSIDPTTFARSIALQLSKIKPFEQALLAVRDKNIHIEVNQTTGPVEPGASVTGVNIGNLIIQGLNGQEAFNQAVLGPLQAIYRDGYDQPVVMMADSLDEALASKTDIKIIDLLEGVQGLDERVHFILTSRSETRVETRLAGAHRFSLSDTTHEAENKDDIHRYVILRLSQSDLASKMASLPSVQVEAVAAEVSARAAGNFQYVVFLLKAIGEGMQPLDNLAGLPVGLDGLYHQSLQRVVDLGKKDWATVYKPFLGVLSVALEALPLDLLETYTASAADPWDVYNDLIQFVEATRVRAVAGEKITAEKRYRIYHQSMIDFLNKQEWVTGSDGQQEVVFTNRYYIKAGKWHEQIVNSYTGPAGDWSLVDWSAVDLYTLRYLTSHLYQLRQNNIYRARLHTLLETHSFIDQHLARFGKPYLLLDDLRLALNLALERGDLAQAWRHIREFRRIVRDQLDFEKFSQAVEAENKTGDYGHVMENTVLYGYLPNSQALARLWAAWNASASGHVQEAKEIVQRALDRLPPRGTVQAGSQDADSEQDAVGEALQRLLIRTARSAVQTLNEQENWLREAISSWPAQAVDVTVERLSEPMSEWGKIVGAQNTGRSMDNLLQELQAMGGRLDPDVASPVYRRERIYFFQKQLAAGLFNSRDDPNWLEYIKRTVALIALDDYPSYREIALSWVAVVVLAQENTALAQQALAIVLGGMFKPSPGFWGDTVAAALDGMNRENNYALDRASLEGYLMLVEATGERGVDPTVPRKIDLIIEWRRKVGLPDDPWSFSMRRRCAVAAVLHRRGDIQGAEGLLQTASAESHEGSYAGFRALARLSLAFRWLEWRNLSKALAEIPPAVEDVSNMNDEILRQERASLVEKVRGWLSEYGLTPSALSENDALAQIQRMSGLERGLFIEFLSALWADNAARLKRLLPLALDDATTADAVLGRLLGVEAISARPERPFYKLVDALHIDRGVQSE